MAQISGTVDALDIAGGREDLEDTIWDLFPADTWMLTNLDKVNAEAVKHEWLADSLAGATANRQVEGDDAAFTTAVAASRYGNWQQISRKTFLISGTVEAIKKAGRKSEIARQAMKQMRELKRDMEQALIGNQASSAGGNTTARSTGSLESWIASTDNGGNGLRSTIAATASTTGYTTTTGAVTSPTDGTTNAALTEAKFKEALQLAWTAGGDPRIVLAGATQKTAIDAFTGIATRFVDVMKSAQASIIGAADLYVSDFGKHTVVLSRYIRASVVIAIDPDYLAVSFLRRPFTEALAKTGDGEKRQILSEFGLVVRNPLAHSKVAACS